MKDIDIFGFKFVWKSNESNSCDFCDLKKTNRTCPNNCSQNGYYELLGGEDLRYYDMIQWIKKNKPNFGKNKTR